MRWAIISALVLLASCSKPKQNEVGQYVYADYFNTIHVDRECASRPIENPKSKEERIANRCGVTFIDTCYFDGYYYNYNRYQSITYEYCPKCIDDDTYARLSEIMKQNCDEQ